MGQHRSSAGDPARTLQLLWSAPRPPNRPGPRPGLDLREVVRAALAIADADGLDAVSMRRVAQRLGVGPMTLYGYVPGKAELLDVMLDTVYLQMPRPNTTGLPWQQRLRTVAEGNRRLFEAHPWASLVSTTRPVLGPGQLAKYEHELSALDGLGLDDVEMDAALTLLLGFVQTCARAAADSRDAATESAISDESWWAANAPVLSRFVDPHAYPLATRVGTAAGAAHGSAYEPEHAYEFGLARLLDGLAALVDPVSPARRPQPARRPGPGSR